MSEVYYRKWRPRTFGELVGQDVVTHTLSRAVALGRVSHAYLFCGPRGTGKTSAARILAKAANCLAPDEGEPDNTCALCVAANEARSLDLVEIDAASNRGIDDIRNLSDKIHFTPNESRYRVYIIDEVHMLTEPAFNALLKTLEEPPGHAMFISGHHGGAQGAADHRVAVPALRFQAHLGRRHHRQTRRAVHG